MNEPLTLREARSFLRRVSIPPVMSLGFGVVICSLTWFIGWSIMGITWGNGIISFLFSFLFLGLSGLRKVEPSHHGAITMLGKRVFESSHDDCAKSIFSEGWHWVLPFMGVIQIKTTLHFVDSGEITVSCFEPTTQTSFEVAIGKVSLTYLPWHVFRVIDAGGMDQINQNIVDTAVEAIREQASDITAPADHLEDVSAIGKKMLDIFSSRTSRAIRDRLLPDCDPKRGMDNESREPSSLGIIVTAVQLGTLLIKSDRLRKALEAQAVEENQRKGEQVQIKAVVENTKALAAIPGISPDAAFSAAQRVSKLLRDSDIIIERRGSGPANVGDDLLAAEALRRVDSNHEAK